MCDREAQIISPAGLVAHSLLTLTTIPRVFTELGVRVSGDGAAGHISKEMGTRAGTSSQRGS